MPERPVAYGDFPVDTVLYDGLFPLEVLADDECVRSAGDGSAACVIVSPAGDRRIEIGDVLMRGPRSAWSDGLGADDIAVLNADHADECEHVWKFVCMVGNAPAYRCEQCRGEKHD